MAAFPYPFHLDSALLPFKNLSTFIEQPNTNSISQISPPELLLDQNSAAIISDNELSSVTNKHSSSSFSIAKENKLQNGDQVTQQLNYSMENYKNKRKKNNCNNSNASSSTSLVKDGREGRSKKQKKRSKEIKGENKPKAKEEPPTGYIHVRARRGQATDSHSLAERVRREKISERMKILEKLVPGCDKVTGKALMLDEIINYVQSLQNQVEFLSMKLATVNPLIYHFGMDIDPLTPRSDQELSNYISPLSPMQHEIQESGSLMWDVNEQMQKFLYQSGIISNPLCSFH